MNLREKMKISGVSLQEVADAVPEANHTAVCHVLNEKLSDSIKDAAKKLVDEKSSKLKESLEKI